MPDPAELIQAARKQATLLVLFIPSANRKGKSLGKDRQQRWVRKAMEFLGERLHGATAFPRGWGVWRDDARGGRLVWDRPVLIQCFTDEDSLAANAVPLRDFLVEMGTATGQGAVGWVVDRAYFEIEFPLEGE